MMSKQGFTGNFVEKIVTIFEEYDLKFGNRHDF